MDAMTYIPVPGIAGWARGDQPDVPTEDDGNHWFTGKCFLYCMGSELRVMWIGPATIGGTTVGMTACSPCIGTLHSLVWEATYLGDRTRPVETSAAAALTDGRRRARSGQHRAP